jgi:hypothetical protein
MQFLLFTHLVHYCRLGQRDPPTVLAVLRDTEDKIERAMIEERAAAEVGRKGGASGGEGGGRDNGGSAGLQSRQLEVSPGKMVLRSGGGGKGVGLGQGEQSRGRTPVAQGALAGAGELGAPRDRSARTNFARPMIRGICD